jgi:hypothetical protein
MRIISIILLIFIFGCNQKPGKKEIAEVHLLCKSDELQDTTQIDISKGIVKVENIFIDELEYAKYKLTDSEVIVNWKDNDNSFNDSRYQIWTMNVNRYTGKYKLTLVNYFPNSSDEKESEPHIINGSCQSFNEKKF